MSPYSYCDDKAYVELLTFGMLVFAVMLGVIFFLIHKIQHLLSYIQTNLASRAESAQCKSGSCASQASYN
jgi:hypothetical protein